jgi:hypothetical protein
VRRRSSGLRAARALKRDRGLRPSWAHLLWWTGRGRGASTGDCGADSPGIIAPITWSCASAKAPAPDHANGSTPPLHSQALAPS